MQIGLCPILNDFDRFIVGQVTPVGRFAPPFAAPLPPQISPPVLLRLLQFRLHLNRPFKRSRSPYSTTGPAPFWLGCLGCPSVCRSPLILATYPLLSPPPFVHWTYSGYHLIPLDERIILLPSDFCLLRFLVVLAQVTLGLESKALTLPTPPSFPPHPLSRYCTPPGVLFALFCVVHSVLWCHSSLAF